MAGGFRVDLAALTQAAQGISDTLADLDTRKVGNIGGDKASIGHDRLADVLSDFCSRWQIGVQNLANDARAVADRLTDSVIAYQNVERANHGQFTGILRNVSGPDPAAH